MAVPKKKVSITRKHRRHAAWVRKQLRNITNKVNLVKCPNCGAPKYTHRVCLSCGYYKGQQVITIKVKEKTQVEEV